MIRKIRESLFAKVFLSTTFLLLCMSFLVFGLLAWLTPKTYSNRLNAALDGRAKLLVSELGQTDYEHSGGLFDQFFQNPEIYNIELYAENGRPLPLPSARADFLHQEYNIAVSSADDFSGTPPIAACSYSFSFADSPARYLLVVSGTGEPIAQLKQSFLRVFPVLLAICVFAALLLSLFYSRLITRPVLKISRISEKMSDLQFSWQLDENRPDELGRLEKSLNALSRKLAATISDLQRANEKLAGDIEREKALEQAQLDFFYAVSHELKTPVTIIKGQLEGMLLKVGAYQDREKYLGRCLEIAGTLENMVQEILTIARLEAMDEHFAEEVFDCAPLVRNYLADVEDLIIQKELQISSIIPAAAYISGNPLLMEKVFSNLIGNAVKYSPQGAKICILMGNGQGEFHFSVENSGVHIPKECIPKLFDAFYRVEQSRNRKSGGSGLGLYLVKKILLRYQSCCLVCNTATGVRFSFTIPAAP